MATLYERLLTNIFSGREKYFMIGKSHRSKLGHMVRTHFQSTRPGERYEKTQSNEENGETFTTNNYPEDFTPEIDRLIKSYYRELLALHKARKEAMANQTPQKKQRTRIAVKKPVYSSWGK